jgi:hypothetical protein
MLFTLNMQYMSHASICHKTSVQDFKQGLWHYKIQLQEKCSLYQAYTNLSGIEISVVYLTKLQHTAC